MDSGSEEEFNAEEFEGDVPPSPEQEVSMSDIVQKLKTMYDLFDEVKSV